MFRSRLFFLLSIFLLTGCTQDTAVPKEIVQEEEVDKNIVVTEDGKITFNIFNTIKISEEEVESIK